MYDARSSRRTKCDQMVDSLGLKFVANFLEKNNCIFEVVKATVHLVCSIVETRMKFPQSEIAFVIYELELRILLQQQQMNQDFESNGLWLHRGNLKHSFDFRQAIEF